MSPSAIDNDFPEFIDPMREKMIARILHELRQYGRNPKQVTTAEDYIRSMHQNKLRDLYNEWTIRTRTTKRMRD